MKLQALLSALPNASVLNSARFAPVSEADVLNITSDSRQVTPGSLFLALAGSHTDGHQYLAKAVDAGALALIVEKGRLQYSFQIPDSLPVVVVEDTYLAMAQLSAAWYGEPGKALRLVGVTGTNGKTTVTHLIERMLQHDNQSVGLIGTLGHKVSHAGQYDSTGHTTPMAPELQHILADMRQSGTANVVLEVSSHALAQHRVAGCDFQVAVFTNLTQDHLDFHKTMDAYCEAKCLLFQNLQPGQGRTGVINLDDPYAARFIAACPEGVQVYTYGIQGVNATVRAENVQYGIAGASFHVTTPHGSGPVRLQLSGQFSVYNALAALAAGLALGIPYETCIASLQAVEGIRGRFEVVSRKPFVIVDYAHTPDGLKNVLSAARGVVPQGGRLLCVFGCGGDRDATKRPQMGRIAEELADVVVVTSDNPRSEDPQQIITDILAGIQRFDARRMTVNVDREQAIHQAIDLAGEQDILVIAGKGHEDYQILADRTIHFDDREVVQAYVAGKQPAAITP